MKYSVYSNSIKSGVLFKANIPLLIFSHFNCNASWYRPLLVHLVWDYLYFLDLISVSLPGLEKLLAITSSNKFSAPFSLSSSGTHIMQMLIPSMLSQMSLQLSSLIFIFFSLFSLGDFHYSVFQITDPFLCITLSADSF